ncbi:SWIM zinc finger family protein [Piscinibacter terrae]|uniref:SWIM zinc finger family protein n=1 Tax=Piscinibacter terrae TaxID=2496871 RepID=A0A3N7HQM3_9BURK|nr:SWIM zinc finger family protein [Albitalea terrae]RQP23466.1 SWIM zinc finger family protein [Albitalea terrae]
MSSIREQLAAQLARFDDDAYAALANRGLLRRAQKDLEKGAATIAQDSAESLVMAFGEHRIRFDARGPAHADCSCPAMGMCQHILAAAISLQRMAADEPAAASPEAAKTDAPPIDDVQALQAELLSVPPDALSKHAGKAGYRWAWQYVQDLDLEQGFRVSGERHLLMSFTQPRLAFRYMGGGIDGLIADADIRQAEKYRVAAVLALRRALGLQTPPPEPAGGARTASLDLGRDHALAQTRDLSIDESRRRLRTAASQLFAECVELGLAHLSQGIQERFSTLAVWAQGAEYHRLALLLRRLADHVDLLLQRAGGADEHRLLDELAIANALVGALDAAAARQAAPVHLVGRARTRYDETGTLELMGLGASAWRSAAGYVGLTMVFWCPVDQAFMSCSDARPENQRGFDPVARHRSPGPWSGLGAPAQAAGRRIALQGAQVNASGRVSGSESATATVSVPLPAQDFAAALPVSRSWSELLQRRGSGQRSLLAEPQPMKDWCVIAPAKFGAPQFDANRQALVWPLFDDSGDRLDAELVYDDYTGHAIGRIEQLAADDTPAGTLVVARLRPGPSGTVCEPLSLVRPGAPPGQSAIDSLHFDTAPQRNVVSRWLDKFRQRRDGDALPSALAATMPALLQEHRHWLCRHAERGMPEQQAQRVTIEAQAWSGRLADAGFSSFAPASAASPTPAALVLRWHYLNLQCEQLLAPRA